MDAIEKLEELVNNGWHVQINCNDRVYSAKAIMYPEGYDAYFDIGSIQFTVTADSFESAIGRIHHTTLKHSGEQLSLEEV